MNNTSDTAAPDARFADETKPNETGALLTGGMDRAFTADQVAMIQRIHDTAEDLLRQLKQVHGDIPKTKQPLVLRKRAPKSILIVDDEKSFREILKHILEEDGYEVVEAVNGKDALEKVDSLKPDLLLLDLCLPDIDGWDVIRHVKENPALEKVRVLALSGLSLDQGQITALRTLTWGYLRKAEFTVANMQRQIAQLLGPN